MDFTGQKRTIDTHASTTDPDARLYKKGKGQQAKLCYIGHTLMENRNGLVIDTRVTAANGTAESEAAVDMIMDVPGNHRITVGATMDTTPPILWPNVAGGTPPPMLPKRDVVSALTDKPPATKDIASA